MISPDFGVAELLADAIALGDGVDAVVAAWSAAADSRSVSNNGGSFRAVLLERLIGLLDEDGQLDTRGGEGFTSTATYFPAGDRWEHWRSDDPAPAVEVDVNRADVVAALRRLPPVMRVVLVLRDGAGLSSDDAAQIVSGTRDEQALLLDRARDALVIALERVRAGERE